MYQLGIKMKTVGCYFIIALIIISGCDNIVDNNNSYDYSIEQKMDCFCSQAGIFVKLYIIEDTISNAVRMSDNKKLDYDQFKFYKSIKELNDLVAETDTNKYQLNVNYGADSSYPSYVYIDLKPIKINDSMYVEIADADYSYTTRNYTENN